MTSVFDRARNRARLGFGNRAIHSLDQSRQHEPYVVEGSVESIVLFLRKKAQVARQEEEVFQFACGAGGHVQKLTKFGSTSPSASLRDVRRDRKRSSPHLAGNTVSLVFRKGRCSAVDTQNQRMAFLPDLELLVVLHGVITQKEAGVYLQLITKNCQIPRGLPC
jgi:hypothetical protein